MLAALGLFGLCQSAACASDEPREPAGSASPTDTGAAPATARLEQVLSRSARHLRTRTLDDGTELVEVVGGFQHATVVTITDAGRESHCVTSTDDARSLLEGRKSR